MATNRKIAELTLRYLCRRALQPAWRNLHAISLWGMGFGLPTLCLTESGELNALRQLARALKPLGDEPPVLFDVGANTGEYTAALLEVFGPRVQIHTFEPSQTAFQRLHERFGEHENVRMHRIALGSEAGEAELSAPGPGDVTATLVGTGSHHKHCERVSVRTLDEICETERVERIDLLKIDVEGFEINVLQGCSRLLAAGAIRCIQFEFGYNTLVHRTRLRDFVDLCDVHSFSVYRVVGDGLHPIKYAPRHEIYDSAVNYVAVSNAGPRP